MFSPSNMAGLHGRLGTMLDYGLAGIGTVHCPILLVRSAKQRRAGYSFNNFVGAGEDRLRDL
jgi:hypothetical protein